MSHRNHYVKIDPPIITRQKKLITDWEELEDVMRGGLDFNALSDDQQSVFEKVMTWFEHHEARERYLLKLGGYAGTGKSTIISILARELENSSREAFRIAFCAYTGKASNVLGQKLRQAGIVTSPLGDPHFCGTIHSLIYKPEQDENGRVLDWIQKGEDELDMYSLIIVDEASMVDEEMLKHLKSYGIPILAVGDHGQLPPVKGLSALMVDPDLRLEKIHRQAEGSPIIQLSKTIRETGRLPDDWVNNESVRFCTFNELFGILEPLYATEDINDIAILTYKNVTRNLMNYQARCMRNRKHMGPEPVKGDQFICLRNVMGTLFNGMRGTLEDDPSVYEDHWYKGQFFFPDDALSVKGSFLRHQIGRDKTFSSFDEINNLTGAGMNSWSKMGMLLDYGYALTVHKSQGSQFKHVFLMYERGGYQTLDEFQRWAYTACTRARETLTIVVG